MHAITVCIYADINDSPIICKTSTSAVYSSDLVSNFITKNQIEGACVSASSVYVLYWHLSPYTGFIQSVQYQDISFQLHRKFDRETKRLNKGLSLLGKETKKKLLSDANSMLKLYKQDYREDQQTIAKR